MLYWPPADAGLAYLTLWSLALSLSFTLSMVPYSPGVRSWRRIITGAPGSPRHARSSR